MKFDYFFTKFVLYLTVAHFYYPDIAPDTFKIGPVNIYTLRHTKEMPVEIVGDYKTTMKRLDMRYFTYATGISIQIDSPRHDKFAREVEINDNHYIACFDLTVGKVRKFPIIPHRNRCRLTQITVLLGDILIMHYHRGNIIEIYYDFADPNGRVEILKNVYNLYMARDGDKLAGVFIINDFAYIQDLHTGHRRRLGSEKGYIEVYGKTLHWCGEKSIIYPDVFDGKIRHELPEGYWNKPIYTLFCENQTYIVLDEVYAIPKLEIPNYNNDSVVAAVIDRYFVYYEDHMIWSRNLETGETRRLGGPIQVEHSERYKNKLIILGFNKLVIIEKDNIKMISASYASVVRYTQKYIYVRTSTDIAVYDWDCRFIHQISGMAIDKEYVFQRPVWNSPITFIDADVY